MMYAKLLNGAIQQYPYDAVLLRRDFPNTSFPLDLDSATLADFDVVVVAPVVPPAAAALHRVEEGTPEQSDGGWRQTWVQVPLTPDEVAALKAAQWAAIKATRDRRTQMGGYQAAGKWFHSDLFSRSQQIGLVLLAENIPPGLLWKTMDGSFVEMTPALAQQVFAAAAAQDVATFVAAEGHRAAMEVSDDPATYDFSGGWPATAVEMI